MDTLCVIMDLMIEYCLGFAFNTTLDQVILIKKEQPKWQKGLLNGVGGKVEKGETPLKAMRREFREETGVDFEGWLEFGVLRGLDFRVFLYTIAISPNYFNEAKTVSNEIVVRQNTDNLMGTISNLSWLVPMAKDSLNTRTGFIIDEINLH